MPQGVTMRDPRGEVWSPEHIGILVLDYPIGGAKLVAPQVGRSETAVRVRASRLGICVARHVKRKLTPGKLLKVSRV